MDIWHDNSRRVNALSIVHLLPCLLPPSTFLRAIEELHNNCWMNTSVAWGPNVAEQIEAELAEFAYGANVHNDFYPRLFRFWVNPSQRDTKKTHRFKTEKLRCYSNAKRRKQQWGGSGERMDVDLDVICAHLFINDRSFFLSQTHTHPHCTRAVCKPIMAKIH